MSKIIEFQRKSSNFFNLMIFENENFGKFQNFGNFSILQFAKFQKFPKFYHFENHQIDK